MPEHVLILECTSDPRDQLIAERCGSAIWISADVGERPSSSVRLAPAQARTLADHLQTLALAAETSGRHAYA